MTCLGPFWSAKLVSLLKPLSDRVVTRKTSQRPLQEVLIEALKFRFMNSIQFSDLVLGGNFLFLFAFVASYSNSGHRSDWDLTLVTYFPSSWFHQFIFLRLLFILVALLSHAIEGLEINIHKLNWLQSTTGPQSHGRSIYSILDYSSSKATNRVWTFSLGNFFFFLQR